METKTLEERVDERIEQFNYDKNSIVVREVVRNIIDINDKIGNIHSFSNVNDLVEIPESMFVEYFLPTLLRPSLSDKKGILVKKVGGWQSEFKVISDQDRTVLFICPPFINTLNFADKVKWGEKEIDTNKVLTSLVDKSKLLIDTVVGSTQANELIDGITNIVGYEESDEWTKRWFQVFDRYRNIFVDIVKNHSNGFKQLSGQSAQAITHNSEPLSFDDFE